MKPTPTMAASSYDSSNGARNKGRERKGKSLNMSHELNVSSTTLPLRSNSFGLQDLTRALPHLPHSSILNQTAPLYLSPTRPQYYSTPMQSTPFSPTVRAQSSYTSQAQNLPYLSTGQALSYSSPRKGRPIFKSYDGEISHGN